MAIKHPCNHKEFAEQIRARSTADVKLIPEMTPTRQQPHSLRIWRNGELIHPHIVYEGPGFAVTDANPNGHYVTIYQPNSSTAHKVSVSDFLLTLDHTFIKVRPKRDW